ncbi:bestrophin-2-like isoform X2 [Daphnia pulicaria]|uniref:bestrophin-2-like isoform X2 n=1 Tax=Daphnia pulicaria TaxID=35523 RepID=UPI001EE9D394|nr:bestrophin-2-like isoform X2 [Daphnia pulicaria]
MSRNFWRNCRMCSLFDGFKSLFLLFKWRSSLYKLCYKELICLLIPYFSLTVVYRKALDEDGKRLFEQFVRYFNQYLDMISLPFILGFYVATVAARWWQQYMALPWPDRLILTIAAYVHGYDAESKKLKKTLVRHCNLMGVLLVRSLSRTNNNCKKILEEAVKLGFMTKREKIYYESIETNVNLYWLPGLWFAQNLQAAFLQGCVKDTYAVNQIMEELLDYRGKCGTLWTYSWISIPLIYTQVVTLAVYSFFFACIMGHQRIVDPTSPENGITADLFYGFSLVLKFFFYMGLLKLAEQMICPYGDGDEHFDVDFLLNRHAQVIQLGTDILSDQCPSAFPELLDQKIERNFERKQSVTQKDKKNCINQPFDSHMTLSKLFSSRMISAFNILHRPTRVAPEKNHVDGSFPFVSNELEISYDTRAKTQKTDERWFAKYWKRSSGSCEVSSRRTNLDTGNNEQSFVHLSLFVVSR